MMRGDGGSGKCVDATSKCVGEARLVGVEVEVHVGEGKLAAAKRADAAGEQGERRSDHAMGECVGDDGDVGPAGEGGEPTGRR